MPKHISFGFLFFVCAILLQGNLIAQKKQQLSFDKIDQLIFGEIQNQHINGAVVHILKDNEPIYQKAYGYRNIDKDSLQINDIFRMASQTKAITTVVIMQLIEEKKLNLYDPVEKYIPAFANPRVIQNYNPVDTSFSTIPANRSLTIFDLLTHTSGIGYPIIGTPEAIAIYEKYKIPSGVASNEDTLAVVINRLASLPLFHQPGSRWTYGINLEVLGAIIEKVTDSNLEDEFRKRIFDPLGMSTTYFTLPINLHPKLVTIYATLNQQPTQPLAIAIPDIGPLIENYPKLKNHFYAGGAGLSGSIEDYGKFLSMLLNMGTYNGQKILSEESVQMMTTHQIGDLRFSGEFGLGFQINGAERRSNEFMSVGAYQWSGAFGTVYWVDPKENLIVLIYTNVWPRETPDFFREFQKLVYEAVRD